VELPDVALTAAFTDDSVLALTPLLVGPTKTKNSGIIGETVDLDVEHLKDMRRSTLLMRLTKRLMETKWREPGEALPVQLFGPLKRITRDWLDTCLVCTGDTYPAQLLIQELGDMACERITNAITRAHKEDAQIKAMLDPYNASGSTRFVNFQTTKTSRWQTDPRRCHVNWVILDSDWEAEFCRVAEDHPRVVAYVKNHNLGLEVPYVLGGEKHRYRPDFIVQVDDGHEDPLHLIVEVKGYRGEDAKVKKETMETQWVPGVNNDGSFGRWAFAEFTEVFRMEVDFGALVEAQFNDMVDAVATQAAL
jgi:type III restriction enzyme